jgi:DNA-binding SARP family transcriptional activator
MSSSRVRIEVLGTLRVTAATGEEITLSGVLQRRLLALLVLRRGSAVSPDAAMEALWPTGLPHDPAAALQNHVSRLRQRLPAGIVESVASGYRLDADRVDIDAERLESLVAAEPLVAAPELRRLFAGWHGAAYPDLEEYDAARVEAARLDELRQRGRESLAEARLAVGDLNGLVTELAAMADADPLRERPRELLIGGAGRFGSHRRGAAGVRRLPQAAQ